MRNKCFRILSAVVSRLFFSLHASVMIFVLCMLTENLYFLLMLISDLLLFIEMTITLQFTKKGEWKWFSPMVFIYLCTVLPSIIIGELDLFEKRVQLGNSTHYECMDYDYNKYAHILQGLEETVILVLVIGRWLMPKGGLTRDQLSQLLLTYLALGADILDVLQLIKETKINTNRNVTVVGLCLFCWAILQFTIVLTQTASPSSQKTSVTEESLTTSPTIMLSPCCDNEIWSVIITIGMQDGPFLLYRIYLAAAEAVFNESMTFFICKNTLTVIIQIYRVVVYLHQKKRDMKIALQPYIDTGISQTDMSVT